MRFQAFGDDISHGFGPSNLSLEYNIVRVTDRQHKTKGIQQVLECDR